MEVVLDNTVNYELRPAKTVELTTVTVNKFVKRDSQEKIIARLDSKPRRVVIWEGTTDYNAHKDDTDEQLCDQLKAILQA